MTQVIVYSPSSLESYEKEIEKYLIVKYHQYATGIDKTVTISKSQLVGMGMGEAEAKKATNLLGKVNVSFRFVEGISKEGNNRTYLEYPSGKKVDIAKVIV